MKINFRPLSSRLLRLSLPVLGAVLVCGILLLHLPAAQPSQAGTARQAPALLAAQVTITPGLEIILEQPALTPPAVECKKDFWQPIPSGRDTTAYLTMNVNNPAASTNSGEWRPVLPGRGYYLIEAYIPLHDPIDFCTDGIGVISSDTSQAHYTVRHALGSSEVVRSQVLPSEATRWVSLGEFLLPAGTEASVRLTDLNSETNLSRTIAFSAMRFTYLRPAPLPIYLPLVANTYHNPLLPPAVIHTQGQGFDACGLPTLEQIHKMQTWWDESPYQAVGVYMGGVHYPTSVCTPMDAAWVSAVSAQGWQFMPLWVGPQAPCTTFTHRISYDPAEAYLQGRSEAELASTAARSLGLGRRRHEVRAEQRAQGRALLHPPGRKPGCPVGRRRGGAPVAGAGLRTGPAGCGRVDRPSLGQLEGRLVCIRARFAPGSRMVPASSGWSPPGTSSTPCATGPLSPS